MIDGDWLLFEDIDCATNDVVTLLVSLIERNSLNVPGYRDNIVPAPGFQMFFTQRFHYFKYAGHLKSKFPYFFSIFCELINVKLQGDIIFEFLETLKIMMQSLHENVQNTVLRMELPLRVVAPCEVCIVICSSPTQNKSAIEIQ